MSLAEIREGPYRCPGCNLWPCQCHWKPENRAAAATAEALRAELKRVKAQRDLVIYLALTFSPDSFQGGTKAAEAFGEFQSLRAAISKSEGYHPGWFRPILSDKSKEVAK